MKPAQFRAERQRHWLRLRTLVDRIERGGIRSLTVTEVRELGSLYRSTVSSYTVLKGLTLDRKLVLFLRNLVTRAYLAIYHYDPAPNVRPLNFLLDRWPRLVKRHGLAFLLALGVFLVSMAISWQLTLDHPHTADILMPAALAQGRGSDSTRDQLAGVLRAGRDGSVGQKAYFWTFLFRNNTQVGILAFALGFAAGIPTLLLTAYNGLPLGALAGLYADAGLSGPFWAWILPHGVTEILAILLCAQAGLAIGFRVIRPGRLRWRDAVYGAGRDGGLIVLGTVPLFFIAGMIESVIRQSHMSDGARFLFAAATVAAWGAFFGFAGRGDPEADDTAGEAVRAL